MFGSEMRVPHNRLKRAVPKQLCNCAQIYPRHNESTCKGVAVAMPAIAGYFRLLKGRPQKGTEFALRLRIGDCFRKYVVLMSARSRTRDCVGNYEVGPSLPDEFVNCRKHQGEKLPVFRRTIFESPGDPFSVACLRSVLGLCIV